MTDLDHADAAKYAEIAIESEYKSHANLAACYRDSQAKLEAEREAHKQTSRQANEAIETANASCAAAESRLREVEAFVDGNMTFYDVNTQCSTQHPNIPVLASVSKRIWYHATDNQLDFPFSQVVRSALKENT